MAPRRYRKRVRADAEEATRQRIVSAAVALHERTGIGATSWDELAAAAGLSRATVYRHFRGLEELIPACARHAFEAIDLPSRAVIDASLADLTDVSQRLRRIVAESCACYERGAGWLRAARREADLIPALAEVNGRIRDGVATLVDAALAGRRIDGEDRTALLVLVGYPFWQELIDAGIAPTDAPALIGRLVDAVLVKGGSGG